MPTSTGNIISSHIRSVTRLRGGVYVRRWRERIFSAKRDCTSLGKPCSARTSSSRPRRSAIKIVAELIPLVD